MKGKSLISVILGLAAILSLSSCQTTSTSNTGSAVMCDKCKTVWVSRPDPAGLGAQRGPGYVVYRDVKSMTCPDCESAVATFFKSGSLKHRCSHCGGSLTHCTTH